jgi:hypothetical protein
MGMVHATINGIILHCDDSVLDLQLGNGYRLEKKHLDELPFKNKITDGEGKLTINYLGSQLKDDQGVYFICITKEEDYEVIPPELKPGVPLTDRDIRCESQIEYYKQEQMRYLHKVFSLLHLFKKGNIGFVQMFFEQKYTALGFITNNMKHTDNSVSKNVIDDTMYTLSDEELSDCNTFLGAYDDSVYCLIKDNIDEFIWGLEQIDIPTGFEQYTTSLEMTMLAKGQQGKKEALSKRVAVLLESSPVDRKNLYDKMKDFYRYRSESLHEGDGQNITKAELVEMEEVVRRVLVMYLEFCKSELATNPLATWEELKAKKIKELKAKVVTVIAANELPQ